MSPVCAKLSAFLASVSMDSPDGLLLCSMHLNWLLSFDGTVLE